MFASKRRQNFSQTYRTEANRRTKDTMMNNQRREKLKQLLIQRYQKVFGKNSDEKIIQSEVEKILKKQTLTENDLKILESDIRKKLLNKQEQDNLKINLTCQSDSSKEKSKKEESKTQLKEAIKLPDINNCDTRSAKSGMSGGSDLDRFNERGPGDKVQEQEDRDFQKIKTLGLFKKQPPKRPKIDYSKYNDEWDAINMYNKKLYEDDIRINQIKDKEIQNRMRNYLQNQIKTKLIKEYEEQLQKEEYQKIMLKHLNHLNELEEKRRLEIEKMVENVKEERKKQLKDKYIRNRIEELKKKKFERELVKNLQDEIKREKQMEIDKKIAENKVLRETIKDNELYRQKLKEKMKKELEDDIKVQEDAIKIKEARENETREFYNSIQRTAQNQSGKMVEKVLKEREDKIKEEDEKVLQYLKFKNKQALLEDKRKEEKKEEDKKMLKQTLLKQMEERRKMMEYEEEINKAQGRIMKLDTQKYFAHEREIEKLMAEMKRNNQEYLKFQMEENRNRMKNKALMSETEVAMNRDVLEKVAEME